MTDSGTMPPFPRRRALALAAAAGLAAPAPARAQGAAGGADWPNRPVRYINPYPPGGPTDTLSRVWCARMSEIAGQQFVVENRGGSGGNVGVDAVAKSARRPAPGRAAAAWRRAAPMRARKAAA